MNHKIDISESQNYLMSALMLDWIGQAPVTIHRAFIDLTGNVLAALWLTYALDKAPTLDVVGSVVIEMTSTECERDTGITRAQQQTCRKVLAAHGILTEDSTQGKALRYRIDTKRLLELLQQQAQPLADALRDGDKRSMRGHAPDAQNT